MDSLVACITKGLAINTNFKLKDGLSGLRLHEVYSWDWGREREKNKKWTNES
jgi:hypothetical protein